MQKLFNKILALLPKNSDGQELAEYGIRWSVYESSSGSQGLVIRFSGLEIHIMMSVEEENRLDEATRQTGSFEELIFRAVLAAQNSNYVHMGDLGTLGLVRYIFFKNLCIIANEIIDAENLKKGTERLNVESNAVGKVCRKVFRFPVHRTGHGWVMVLDGDKIERCKRRFGFEE